MTKNTLLTLAVTFTGLLAFAGTSTSLAGDKEKTGPAAALSLTPEDQAALELGRKVQAVKRAIANPETPDAMKAVKDLGLDQRHYVMVRGWLSYQLAADQSILDASRERTPKPVKDRIAFLQRAIRAIDLEH